MLRNPSSPPVRPDESISRRERLVRTCPRHIRKRSADMHVYAICRLAIAVAIGTLSGLAVAADEDSYHEHQHDDSRLSSEFVVFTSAEAHYFSTPMSTAQLNEDASLQADAVFAFNWKRFRMFGEYLLSSEEHDLERFQVGFEPVPETIVWGGRFHQPASGWNTEHHHGRYLQSAITRPSV